MLELEWGQLVSNGQTDLWALAGIAVVLQQRMAQGTDNIKWSLCESNFIIPSILLQQVDFHYRHVLPCVLLMCGLTQRCYENFCTEVLCFKKQYRKKNGWTNTVFLTERKTNSIAVLKYNSIKKVWKSKHGFLTLFFLCSCLCFLTSYSQSKQ